MSDDAVQLEILEAEKVIRGLASKLQEAAKTAETLALSQKAYSEAGEALQNVATLLSKTHDLITEQSKTLSAAADSLVSRGNDVIAAQSEKLSAATDSLVSGANNLIADQGKKLSDAVSTLVSKGHDEISDQRRKLSAAAESLVSRTNEAMKERSKALWDTADALQNTNRLLSNTREEITREGKSWGTAAASIAGGLESLKLSTTEGLNSVSAALMEDLKSIAASIAEGLETLKLSAAEGLQSLRATIVEDLTSITTSIGKSPHSIISKLDLLETHNTKDLNEASASIRADLQSRSDEMKQAIILSDLATAAAFESAALSIKHVDKVVCNRANEIQGLLRKIAKNGSYFLWVIVGINGLVALGVAVILIKLFSR